MPEPVNNSDLNTDNNSGHITRRTHGPKLGEIVGPKLRYREPIEETRIDAPTANTDDEVEYELDDGTSITPAPELPNVADVQAYTAKVSKLVSQLMKKSAALSDTLTSEEGSITDGVSPRVIEQNVAIFATLFEKGRTLLSHIHPRHFTVQTTAEAPFTLLKNRAEKMTRYLDALAVTEQSLANVLSDTPENIRETFHESVLAMCAEDPSTLQSDSLQIYRIYEQARWKLIADATGATRGLRAPEPATGGGSSASNEKANAAAPTKAAKADKPPERKRKTLNYGRPGDESPAKNATDESADVTSTTSSSAEQQDDEQMPLTAAELAEQGRNEYNAELLKNDIAAHRDFMASIRTGKDQKHKMYGKLNPAFLKTVNSITDRDEQLTYLDGTMSDVGHGLVSWLQLRIGYEREEGEKLPIAHEAAKEKCEPVIDHYRHYNAVETQVKTLAALLRLVEFEDHLSQEDQRALKLIAPSAADITVLEATPEMQLLVTQRNRERQIEEKLTLLAKQALVRHANDRDMRLANGDDGRWKVAMRIAKQQLEESGWQPTIKE